LAKVRLSHHLDLAHDHAHNLLGCKVPRLATVLNVDHRLAVLLSDLKKPVLHILLKALVVHIATQESRHVEDGVLWVRLECVPGGLSNKDLLVPERDPRRRAVVASAVGDDVCAAINTDANARVCVPQVYRWVSFPPRSLRAN
jgi:hypothetical protein